MKIIKKPVWRNQKCNECGRPIYQSKKDGEVYFCWPEFLTEFKTWKLCKECVNKIFSEEVVKKVK